MLPEIKSNDVLVGLLGFSGASSRRVALWHSSTPANSIAGSPQCLGGMCLVISCRLEDDAIWLCSIALITACFVLLLMCRLQGKSTVIVHRLVDRELAYQVVMELQSGQHASTSTGTAAAPAAGTTAAAACSSSSSCQGADMPQHLPQLLVTRSEKLCSKLSKEVQAILAVGSTCLTHDPMAAAAGNAESAASAMEQLQGPKLVDSAAVTTVQRQAPLPDSFTDVTGVHFPLMLTVRQLTDMLNASLPEPFTPARSASSRDNSTHHKQPVKPLTTSSSSSAADSEEDAGYDSDDSFNDAWISTAAPAAGASWEAAVGVAVSRPFGAAPTSRLLPALGPGASGSAAAGGAFTPGLEVDFDIFLGQYWGRFDTRLTRELEPSMVFAGVRTAAAAGETVVFA